MTYLSYHAMTYLLSYVGLRTQAMVSCLFYLSGLSLISFGEMLHAKEQFVVFKFLYGLCIRNYVQTTIYNKEIYIWVFEIFCRGYDLLSPLFLVAKITWKPRKLGPSRRL